jgi:hypothetical protein
VAYSLRARIVESQQPAFTGPQPVNSDRGMVFSAHSVPMAVHITVEYMCHHQAIAAVVVYVHIWTTWNYIPEGSDIHNP